jgi:hypothetical protein
MLVDQITVCGHVHPALRLTVQMFRLLPCTLQQPRTMESVMPCSIQGPRMNARQHENRITPDTEHSQGQWPAREVQWSQGTQLACIVFDTSSVQLRKEVPLRPMPRIKQTSTAKQCQVF